MSQAQEDEVHLGSIYHKANSSLVALFGLGMVSTQVVEMALHSPDVGVLRKQTKSTQSEVTFKSLMNFVKHLNLDAYIFFSLSLRARIQKEAF